MRTLTRIAAICCFFAIAASLIHAKDRSWQTAKLLSAELSEGDAVAVPINGAIVTGRIKSWVYVLETETTVYETQWRSPKPLSLTVNGFVKFAVEKGNVLFLIDEDGKERKLGIVRKTAKSAN
jgi:hypothetical protein